MKISYWYLHQNLSWRMVDKEKSHKYRVLEHFDDKSLTESLSWLLYSSKFVFLSKHPFCTWSSISWCQSAISSYCVLLSIVILYCAGWHQIKYWNAINTWTVQGGNEWTRMSDKDFLGNIHLLPDMILEASLFKDEASHYSHLTLNLVIWVPSRPLTTPKLQNFMYVWVIKVVTKWSKWG